MTDNSGGGLKVRIALLQAEIERLETAGLDCAFGEISKTMELEDHMRWCDQKDATIECLQAQNEQLRETVNTLGNLVPTDESLLQAYVGGGTINKNVKVDGSHMEWIESMAIYYRDDIYAVLAARGVSVIETVELERLQAENVGLKQSLELTDIALRSKAQFAITDEIEHLQADLAETISERDDARKNNEILRNQLANPIEQFIRIQVRENGTFVTHWRNVLVAEFPMSEIQQAFVELGKWQRINPKDEYRLVSIAVTLLPKGPLLAGEENA